MSIYLTYLVLLMFGAVFTDEICTFKNVGVIIDSTKLVKKREFTEYRIEENISVLLNQMKLQGLSTVMSGRVYHRNEDCQEKEGTLADHEYFEPTRGPGNIRDALKHLRHHNSSDDFHLPCAEQQLFAQYKYFSNNYTVGIVIAVYDSVKDTYPSKDGGLYWVFVYHQRQYVGKILITSVKNRDREISRLLHLLMTCQTLVLSTTPHTSFTSPSTRTITTKPTPVEPYWKLQQLNVCFGARDNSYGKIYLQGNGILQAFKLVYKSGYLSCKGTSRSHWGCDPNYREMMVIVTDEANIRVFPKGVDLDYYGAYLQAGFHSMKNVLAFTDFSSPMYATEGQEIRIWYSEDLLDKTEGDNSGQTCADVYAKYY